MGFLTHPFVHPGHGDGDGPEKVSLLARDDAKECLKRWRKASAEENLLSQFRPPLMLAHLEGARGGVIAQAPLLLPLRHLGLRGVALGAQGLIGLIAHPQKVVGMCGTGLERTDPQTAFVGQDLKVLHLLSRLGDEVEGVVLPRGRVTHVRRRETKPPRQLRERVRLISWLGLQRVEGGAVGAVAAAPFATGERRWRARALPVGALRWGREGHRSPTVAMRCET